MSDSIRMSWCRESIEEGLGCDFTDAEWHEFVHAFDDASEYIGERVWDLFDQICSDLNISRDWDDGVIDPDTPRKGESDPEYGRGVL